MNTTKVVSLAVASMACRSSFQSSRLRASAMASAPVAPMAPPSVGVATPMKMVPSTRKISASGGIRTKVTFSAMVDSRPRPVMRLITAATNAVAMPTIMLMTISSSVGLSAGWAAAQANAAPTESAVSTSKEIAPLRPPASRKERASGGSAGADCGLIRVRAST